MTDNVGKTLRFAELPEAKGNAGIPARDPRWDELKKHPHRWVLWTEGGNTTSITDARRKEGFRSAVRNSRGWKKGEKKICDLYVIYYPELDNTRH